MKTTVLTPKKRIPGHRARIRKGEKNRSPFYSNGHFFQITLGIRLSDLLVSIFTSHVYARGIRVSGFCPSVR